MVHTFTYLSTHLLRKLRVTCQIFSLKGATQFPFSRFSPSPNILQLQSLNSRFLSNILISSLRGQGHDRPLFKPWCGVVVTCDMDHALSSTTIVVACARNNFWRDQRPTPPQKRGYFTKSTYDIQIPFRQARQAILQ